MNYMILSFISVLGFSLLFLSFMLSLSSDILRLSINERNIGLMIVVIIFTGFFIFRKKIKLNINKYENNLSKYYWVTFLSLILYQFIIVFNYNALPNADAGTLLAGLNSPHHLATYLSNYPNNQLFYFLNAFISLFIGTNVLYYKIINIIVLAFSTLLVKIVASKMYNKKIIGYYCSFIFMIYVQLQPIFMVPYTDSYCLPPLLLSSLFILESSRTRSRLWIIIFSSLAGIFFATAYLIRPSSIIFIIAFLIFAIILPQNFNRLNKFLKSLFFCLFSVLTFSSFSFFINNQNYTNINSDIQIPMVHFLLLGSSGDPYSDEANHGTWNEEDITLTHSQKNTNKMKEVATKKLLERLKSRTLFENLLLYLQKYRDNSDTGVIGYHRDGLWLNYDKSSKNIFYQLFAEKGYYRNYFNFFCQILWLFTLFFCLYSTLFVRIRNNYMVILTIIGGLLFLLMFESGGTKYLLQYIPWICLLSGAGFYEWQQSIIKNDKQL